MRDDSKRGTLMQLFLPGPAPGGGDRARPRVRRVYNNWDVRRHWFLIDGKYNDAIRNVYMSVRR